jgi:nitroreductase
VPQEVRVVALLPLGYPAKQLGPRPRKSLDEIIAWEHW